MAVARSRGPWRRHIVLLLTAGLALGLIAGCSNSATHARSLRPVPRASASLTTDVASQETVQGMQAFIRQYYGAINAAVATGNVAPIYDATTVSCPCRRLATFISSALRKGRISGFRYRVSRITDSQIEGADGSALLDYSVSAARLISSSGAIISSEPAFQGTASISLIWTGARWLISNSVRLQ